MKSYSLPILFLCAIACGVSTRKGGAEPAAKKPLPYTGVNLAGGEFYSPKPREMAPPYGQKFIYPNAQEFDYFTGKGMNVFRFPFRWEILQPERKAPLNPPELARFKAAVKTGTDKGAVIILDPHDYARYFDKVIGGPDVSAEDFADFWAKLAIEFKDNPRVWFGLMNEPHDLPGSQWRDDANAAIAAIRKAGAKNMILVPGIAWTGAHSWISSGNGAEMLKIVDPSKHYAFDAHQYLDSDSSGTHKETVSATIGSERLRVFTEWCRTNKKKAFLGEVGAAANPTSEAAVGDMLTYMEANADVWLGYSWWAAGAWWGDYMYSIEPKEGQDKPQMAYLAPHLQPAPPMKSKMKSKPRQVAP